MSGDPTPGGRPRVQRHRLPLHPGPCGAPADQGSDERTGQGESNAEGQPAFGPVLRAQASDEAHHESGRCSRACTAQGAAPAGGVRRLEPGHRDLAQRPHRHGGLSVQLPIGAEQAEDRSLLAEEGEFSLEGVRHDLHVVSRNQRQLGRDRRGHPGKGTHHREQSGQHREEPRKAGDGWQGGRWLSGGLHPGYPPPVRAER